MYKGTLIAVKNIEESKKFYHDILDMNVVGDFGANVQLDGGLFLQTLDTWSDFINSKEVYLKNNAGELYFEVSDIELKLQDELVLYHSTPVDFDAAFLSEKLKEDKIEIIADLNAGSGLGQAWGCDLTYKYVEINALYTS